MTPHHLDLTTELAHDHRTILAAFEQIRRTPADDAHREELLRYAAAELERHAIAEQRFLLPALRQRLPFGDELARDEADEHRHLMTLLDALTGASAARPGYDARVRVLEKEIRRHARHDEDTLFPLLRQACPRDDLARLGAVFRQHALWHG